MTTSPLRLRVEHTAPRTLAALEAACAAARAKGFGDDAEVMPPSVFGTALVIVEPYVEPPADPAGADAGDPTDAAPRGGGVGEG